VTVLLAAGCGTERRRAAGGGGSNPPGEGEGEGSAEGEGEPGRPDEDEYVEEDTEQDVTPGVPEPVTVSAPSGRASVEIPPEAVPEGITVTVRSRRLNEFADIDTILNGIYDFGPDGTQFSKPVKITLPLNGLVLELASELELVYHDGQAWQVVSDAGLELGDDSATGSVTHFTPFGLRLTGGWPGSGEEGEGEGDKPCHPETNPCTDGYRCVEGECLPPVAEGEGEGPPPEGPGECNPSCMASTDGATCCKGCGECNDVPAAARCQPECPDGYSWDCEVVCCFSYETFQCAGVEIGECASACTSRPGAVCCTGCSECDDLPWSQQCRPYCSGSGLQWNCERECCEQTLEGDPFCVGPAD